MTKVISTISSFIAGAFLATETLGDTFINALIGGISIGGIGYSIAFIAIPTLLKNKMLGIASLIGFTMSLTWLMNGSTIYNIYLNNLYVKIDAKYMTYKEIYEKSNYKTTNVENIEKEIIELRDTIKNKSLRIDILSKETSKDGEDFKRIKSEVKEELLQQKLTKPKEWKKGLYIEYAKSYLCENPTRINFKRLLACGARYKFNLQSKDKIDELKELSVKVRKDKITIEQLEMNLKRIKTATQNSNRKIDIAKKKYLAIEKEAEKRAKSIKPYIYLTIWMFGLFVELISMMFSELVEARKKKIEEKEKENSITQMKKEIEEVYEITVKKEFNRENMKRLIAYANNQNDPLRQKMRVKLKSGRGKELAVSNAILGAFLFAYTIKINGKDIVESWKQLTQSNILFVNGSSGTEYINKRERRKLINEYFPNIEDDLKIPIKVLGSTATELKNKDIRKYLNDNRGSINPQQEALNYLINLEKTDKDRFSPQLITIKDIESVALNFVRKYHPNNF